MIRPLEDIYLHNHTLHFHLWQSMNNDIHRTSRRIINMGCDIYSTIEVKTDGKWNVVNKDLGPKHWLAKV